MSRLLFANLAMLAGLAALAIPILIHLLLKRRKHRLRFSTLRFFRQQDEQSSQRRKLRNLLLLAVRLLLLLLLVLAFARPFLPRTHSAAGTQPRRQVVFVVDRSESMQALQAGSSRWTRTKAAVQQALAALTAEDRAALVSCGVPSEVLSGFAPPQAVARLLGDLQPSNGTADLGEGLQLAAKLLSAAEPNVSSSLCIASDLQLAGCQNLAAYPIPEEVDLKFLNVGDVITPNVAVTDLQLNTRVNGRPHAVIANFSDESVSALKLVLSLDGKQVSSQSVTLQTGAVTRVDLSLPALSPGWHGGELRLETEDALAIDNVRYDAWHVPRPVRILVAETRLGKRVYEEESYFVISALDPAQGTTNASASRFTLEKTSPESLPAKLAASGAKEAYDLVILPGLKQIPSGLASALSAFVQGGGGLLLFLGDELGASRYNQELRDMLPATLGPLERNHAVSFEQKWHLDDYDLNAPMFALFRRPNTGNLALPEFTKRFVVVTNENSVVTARFEDGVPAIVTRQFGRGLIVLANTSADTAWTDWPKHKTFVPWLHSVCRQLGGRAGFEQLPTTHFLVTEHADIALPNAAQQKTFRLQRPGDKPLDLLADATGRLPPVNFTMPGVYSLQNQAGQELQRIAVNLPAEESDLAAATPAEFQQKLVRTSEPPPTTFAAGLFGVNSQQKELWRLLLLACLGLLLAEVFLANRTFA